MNNPKRVRVFWVDATMWAGWFKKTESHELHLDEIETVGFLVDKSESTIKIAQSKGGDAWGNITIIPTGWIRKIVYDKG